MSLRLKAASWFIRGGLMTRWLVLVDRTVSHSLTELIAVDHGGASVAEAKMPRSPAAFRKAMAEKHARLVEVLLEQKGIEAGTREGRDAMHTAGIDLGKRLREDLRLSDSEEDLIAAARLLYRILGIQFTVERDGHGAKMVVHRCSLAQHYTRRTCEVISAMDEGVVEGLNPRARMSFIRRNSMPPHPCEADLVWKVVD